VSNQVTDVDVRRVSFVKKASTRDPRRPTEPRRYLLFKAEGATDSERTDDMAATATAPRTEAEVEQLESEWSDLLGQLHDDLERMRSAETPAPIRERHERAYGNLHRALIGLRSPEAASAADARDRARDEDTTDGERALFAKCEQIAKADPTLSAAEQMRRAMTDSGTLAAYYAESGTRPPAPPTRPAALAKAADGFAEHSGEVETRTDELVASGMRPSLAYATALKQSGHYAGAAA
jgi:hypothetical protein